MTFGETRNSVGSKEVINNLAEYLSGPPNKRYAKLLNRLGFEFASCLSRDI